MGYKFSFGYDVTSVRPSVSTWAPVLKYVKLYCHPRLFAGWFHTVFPGPYQAFSIDVLPNFPWSYRCENYIKFFFWSFVECDFQGNRYLHGNNILKNWKSVKQKFCTSQMCYVTEKLMSISEITMYGKGNMQE